MEAHTEQVTTLTLSEARGYFDEQARTFLAMSGDEFIEKYDAGTWPDPDADPAVVRLAMLRSLLP